MPFPCALGIDVGTTNSKVVLVEFTPAASVRARATAPTSAADAFGPALADLVRAVLADRPAPDAVGIASMAETGVPLDADGAPLGDWLRWDGHRAGAEADELADRLGRDQLIAATGVRPSAKVPLATWAWLRGQRPELFAAMVRWAGVADLACLLLTGRLATDHTLAGRTMAYRLPADGPSATQFDADLTAEVGLRPDQLPDVVCADIAGPVRAPAFVDAGIPSGTPVSVAGHDHAVGAYAAGVRLPGQVADSVGTAEAVFTVVETPPDPREVAAAGMSSVVTVDAAHRALLAGSPGAGAFVQWWLENEACAWSPAPLFAAVQVLDAKPSEVIVLPYLHGRQAPAPDPAARVQIIGRAEHSAAELAHAMLQGLCLHARWLFDEQARLAGAPATEPVIALGGPLVANPAWSRLKALVTPQPVCLVTEPEAVAVGAALLSAARAGLVDAADTVLDQQPIAEGTQHRGEYEQALAAFVAAALQEGST